MHALEASFSIFMLPPSSSALSCRRCREPPGGLHTEVRLLFRGVEDYLVREISAKEQMVFLQNII